MQTVVVELKNLVDFLSEKSNKNMTELSEATGISLVTLHNWKNGTVTKLNYTTRLKLGQALEHHQWGFRISEYSDNRVTVIVDESNSKKEALHLKQENEELKNTVYKLTKEILKLQEQLQKYEVKK